MAAKRKRVIVASGALLVAVIAVFLFQLSRPPKRGPEPVYQGKTLSQWMAARKMTDYSDPRFPSTPELASAIEAVKQMGTNALPFLLDDLRARDALIWKKIPGSIYFKFRFLYRARSAYYRGRGGPHERNEQAVFFLRAMGPLATPALPEIAKCLDHPDIAQPALEVLNFYASNGQMSPGPEVTTALLKAMTSGDRRARQLAANTVNLFRVDADLAVPALLRTLRDPAAEVRATSAMALGYRARASVIVPALIGVLDDSDHYVRRNAVWRLGMYGSNAAPAIPKIVGCLSDTNLEVRTEATNAITLIDPEAAKVAGVNLNLPRTQFIR
jgi:HEAT repeat protein